MVLGMSAVSEAVHYLNLRLHNQSVNLEEDSPTTNSRRGKRITTTRATMTEQEFGTMVTNRLLAKRKVTKTNK